MIRGLPWGSEKRSVARAGWGQIPEEVNIKTSTDLAACTVLSCDDNSSLTILEGIRMQADLHGASLRPTQPIEHLLVQHQVISHAQPDGRRSGSLRGAHQGAGSQSARGLFIGVPRTRPRLALPAIPAAPPEGDAGNGFPSDSLSPNAPSPRAIRACRRGPRGRCQQQGP